MAGIAQLGYLGIGVRDLNVWQDLGTTMLGLRVMPAAEEATTA